MPHPKNPRVVRDENGEIVLPVSPKEPKRHMTLKIVQKRDDETGSSRATRVSLDGVDLCGVLAADGVSLAWKQVEGIFPSPEVTLTFAAGAIDVDIEVDVEEPQIVKRICTTDRGAYA